jgi:hypothetical protein
MNVSVYEVSVGQFLLTLNNLKNILKKAEQMAQVKKFDMDVLLNCRLFPDMFPLGKQIQTACDAAKFCGSRLTEITAPSFDDSEKKLADYVTRIDETVKYLKELDADDFKEFEAKRIRFAWNPNQELGGRDYLIQFAIPNFYFHVTTAYNILRHCGVELGKADYLGPIHWQTIPNP